MNNSYEAKMMGTQKNAGCHALVIGGSLAGLFAARVLADFFDKVTILDRDNFPATPDHHKGVPQSYHAHALLPTAFPILERLFSGIMNDLRRDGAAAASNIVPFALVSPRGLLLLPKWPGEIIAFSRPLLRENTTLRSSGVQTLRQCFTITNKTTHVHPTRKYLRWSKCKRLFSKFTACKFCYRPA